MIGPPNKCRCSCALGLSRAAEAGVRLAAAAGTVETKAQAAEPCCQHHHHRQQQAGPLGFELGQDQEMYPLMYASCTVHTAQAGAGPCGLVYMVLTLS